MATDRIEFGVGLALQGGIGGTSRTENAAEGQSSKALSIGGTPASPHVWIRDVGGLLNRKLSGIDLKLALAPEIEARWALAESVNHRLRLDVAVGSDNLDGFGFYGAYDNPLTGNRAWAAGIQSPLIDPLVYAGMFTLQPWLFQFGLVTPAFVEYRRTDGGREQTVTAGLRTQLDWDFVLGLRPKGSIEN